jgi:hypothetical protein
MAIVAAVLLASLSAAPNATAAAAAIQVWFTPASESRDLIEMFRDPQLWKNARSQISVFELGRRQLGEGNTTGINTISDLSKVSAFQLLRSWGISLALEGPAIKPWDCTGRYAAEDILRLIGNARAAGGIVKYVSMDEPLLSGTRFCRDSVENVAAKTAAYIKELKAREPVLEVGDIEAYTPDISQLEQWLTLLTKDGAKPAHFHLDVDVHYVEVHPNIDIIADLRSLKVLLRTQGIPFGIIFWSAHGPEPSSQSYYNHTIAWVKQVHAAIGAPDQAIFESWITRSYAGCNYAASGCAPPKIQCPPSDTSGCGLHSVPINLPEGNPRIFSHTRLVDEGLTILGR